MLTVSRKELNEKYHIGKNCWSTSHDELLSFLNEYMRIEEVKTSTGRFSYNIYEEELPKSIPIFSKVRYSKKEKQKEYEEFTIAALGTEYKPNSQRKIARDAIQSFGKTKYQHRSPEMIAKRYIKKSFNKYGESNEKYVWVDYETYKPLTEEQKILWLTILKDEKIDESAAANAFYREQQGEDISEEKGYYKKALEKFIEKEHTIPVRVKEWRLKNQDLA